MFHHLVRLLVVAILAPFALAQNCGSWLPGAGVPGFTDDLRVAELFVPSSGSPTYVIASRDLGGGNTLYTIQDNAFVPYSTQGLDPAYVPERLVEFNGSVYMTAFRRATTFPLSVANTAFYRWNGAQWEWVFWGWVTVRAPIVHDGRLCFIATWREDFEGHEVFPTGVWSFDGANFSELARFDQRPETLASMNGLLYVGGPFTQVTPSGQSSRAATYLAQWDGATWSGVNFSSLNGPVRHLAVFQPNPFVTFPSLIVCGDFTSAGGAPANHVAAWDPQFLPSGAWSALGSGVVFPAGTTSATWSSLTISAGFNNNDLLVGVACLGPTGWLSAGVQRWTGSQWQTYCTTNGPVLDLVNSAGVLAGGDFTVIDSNNRSNIARNDGSGWQAVGRGTDGAITDLIELNGVLYAAGAFSQIEGVNALRVAAHDTSGWRALGAGLNAEVTCLEAFGGQIYAGGVFTQSGSSAVSGIARWSGSAWVPVGGSLGTVFDMCVWNNQLVACGELSGSVTGRVAVFNGTSWATLGAAPNDQVNALAVHNGELYIGGLFTTAGGFGAKSRVARWTGSAWGIVGPSSSNNGVDGDVSDMISFNGELYVAGSFSNASGTPAGKIARWNGSVWRDLAGAMGTSAGSVYGLSIASNKLVALGTFEYCGTVCLMGMGLWDGQSWSALQGATPGTRQPHYPQVAADHQGIIYLGGNVVDWTFNGSAHLGRWDPLPVITSQPADAEVCPGDTIALSAPLASLSYNTAVWRRGAVVLTNGGRVSGANSTQLTITGAQFGDSGLYTCQITNDCGSALSEPAAVFVRSSPNAALTSPPSTSVPQGALAALDVTVVSTTAFTTQWFRNDVPIVDGIGGAAPGGGLVSGSGTPSLRIQNAQPADGGIYTCLATNLCGEDMSEPVSLVVTLGCAWGADGCFADYDHSGGIDGDDVIAFFGDWDSSGDCADVDASDGVDGDDVIAFFTSWDAGAC